MDTDIYLRLHPGCGSISGKVVILNKALHGLSRVVERGISCYHQPWWSVVSRLVDPCVFRLMVAGDVVAMMVFHVDDIKIAATEAVTEVVVSALNQRFPTKHLGEVE